MQGCSEREYEDRAPLTWLSSQSGGGDCLLPAHEEVVVGLPR